MSWPCAHCYRKSGFSLLAFSTFSVPSIFVRAYNSQIGPVQAFWEASSVWFNQLNIVPQKNLKPKEITRNYELSFTTKHCNALIWFWNVLLFTASKTGHRCARKDLNLEQISDWIGSWIWIVNGVTLRLKRQDGVLRNHESASESVILWVMMILCI